MKNTVYIHTLEEPIKYKDHKGNDAVKETELRCTDERVQKVWYTAMESDKAGEFVAYVHFIFKDGARHEKRFNTDKWEDEASEFLNSIQ